MSLETNISELQPWMQVYIDRLSPTARKKLQMQIAKDLTTANRKRMTAQTDPDGSRWEARKHQENHSDKANKRKLFAKLRMAKSLRKRVEGNRIIVGFKGSAGRLARIHHYGLRERLQYGDAHYPARELIGIPSGDKALTENTIMNHIGGNDG